VENASKATRLHKRCGSSFILFVMLVSIVLFFFIRVSNPLARVGIRILLLPVISGISYEQIQDISDAVQGIFDYYPYSI
jgi:uncharacterized protein YqhQ